MLQVARPRSRGCHPDYFGRVWLPGVVKATIYEDHGDPKDDKVPKIDFWVFGEEAKKVNGGDEYLPIQFTIDSKAACGLKGLKAIRSGVIIVCVRIDELLEWEKSRDSSLRDVVRWRIYKEFWATVYKVAQTFPYMHFARPMCRLARFELTH